MNSIKKTERHHSLRWILLPEAARASIGSVVPVDADKLKHLRKVLRMEWNEPARVTDGAGKVYDAKLVQRGGTGTFLLEGVLSCAPVMRAVELVIGLAKNTTMDWLLEKAVECGVTKITPVVTARSVVKPGRESEKYLRRWQTIMDGAVEQAEQAFRPTIAVPTDFRQWLSNCGRLETSSFSFVSELREDDVDEANLVKAMWQKLRAANGPVRVFIGPEGGMADEERQQLVSAGFTELSLGKTVLRVETAVIAVLILLRVSHLSQ